MEGPSEKENDMDWTAFVALGAKRTVFVGIHQRSALIGSAICESNFKSKGKNILEEFMNSHHLPCLFR